MMTQSEQDQSEAVLAPPGTLRVGSRTFIIRPPAASDYAALHAELRKQVQAQMVAPIEAANRRVSEAERAGKPLSPSVVEVLVRLALAAESKGEKVEPTEQQIQQQLQTLEGGHWYVWTLAQKADGRLTLGEVQSLLPDLAAVRGALRQIDDIAMLDKASPN
jgi:hypothetical protein